MAPSIQRKVIYKKHWNLFFIFSVRPGLARCFYFYTRPLKSSSISTTVYKYLYIYTLLKTEHRRPQNAKANSKVCLSHLKLFIDPFLILGHFRSLSLPRLAFLAWGDFHARSCFARSSIPNEKWGPLEVYRKFCDIIISSRSWDV